jgi:hypothetical protein
MTLSSRSQRGSRRLSSNSAVTTSFICSGRMMEMGRSQAENAGHRVCDSSNMETLFQDSMILRLQILERRCFSVFGRARVDYRVIDLLTYFPCSSLRVLDLLSDVTLKVLGTMRQSSAHPNCRSKRIFGS